MGVAPEQVELPRHCTHFFVAGSQTDAPPVQVELSVHCTQDPSGAHTGRPGSRTPHSADVVHAVQVPVVAEQIGAPAGQVALVTHPTQVPLGAQNVRAGSLRDVHCADVVQAAHVPVKQTGAFVGQVALVKHCTHRLVAVSQIALLSEQVELSMHSTHDPAGEHAARMGSARPAH